MMDKVKISANLSDEAVAALREIADRRGSTLTEALRQAIATERLLLEESAKGSKILVERSDNSIRELVLLR